MHNIQFFTTHNETEASIVERINRKEMWNYFTANSTLKYTDSLKKLVKSYILDIVVLGENKNVLWQNLYEDEANFLDLNSTLVIKSVLANNDWDWNKKVFSISKCVP